MFAILIAPGNIEKIAEHQESLPEDRSYFDPDIYLESNLDWYYVRGYVDRNGKVLSWAVLPSYVFLDNYEYDADKIQTEFDQIVRL